MIKKILFTGTFSSGKTTLLKEFEDHKGIIVVNEVARDLLHADPSLEVVPHFQDLIFEEQIKREKEAVATAQREGKQLILLDRGIIDIVAYSLVFGYKVQHQWISESHNRYDLAFIFDPKDINEIPDIPELGLDMKKYRMDVDLAIRGVIQRLGIPLLEVSGSHERRVRLVEASINSSLLNLEGRNPSTEINY